METYIFILGRSPEISIEELLKILRPIGHIVEARASFLVFQGEIDPRSILPHIGGTVKVGRVVYSLASWDEFNVDHWLRAMRPELHDAQGRFLFGASSYGADAKLRKAVHRTGIELKRRLKSMSLSVRFVSNRDGALSSVAVQKNGLIERELLFCEGRRNYVAVTNAVQDFESYSERDYGRPSRNAERGMLPPKVAQIMLNLASIKKDDRLLDPFCGGGTILQEALFAGIVSVWGSDKDDRAIIEAKKNFDWLSRRFNLPQPALAVHNVYHLDHAYQEDFFDVVVTEPYLGPARVLKRRGLTRGELSSIIRDGNALYAEIFRELAVITRKGGRLVIVTPQYRAFGAEHSVGNLEMFERSGWKSVAPEVASVYPDARLSARGHLVYAREDQTVAREITVWRKL